MIEFIGETIKRAAVSVRKPRKTELPSGMAVQSLNMALSILSLHLTQKNVQVGVRVEMKVAKFGNSHVTMPRGRRCFPTGKSMIQSCW